MAKEQLVSPQHRAWNFIFKKARPFSFCKVHLNFHQKILVCGKHLKGHHQGEQWLWPQCNSRPATCPRHIGRLILIWETYLENSYNLQEFAIFRRTNNTAFVITRQTLPSLNSDKSLNYLYPWVRYLLKDFRSHACNFVLSDSGSTGHYISLDISAR